MTKFTLLSTLVLFTLLFNGCAKDEDVQEEANAMLSTNEFTLTSLAKQQYTLTKTQDGFTLQGAKDKVVILDIFATWCPPCQAEASHLASLQKKYKESLVVLGITVEDGVADAKLEDFRTAHDAHYALVNSSENGRVIDAIAQKLQLGRNFGIPLMAMYKNGKLINYYQGATEEEFIESDIKKALGK